MGALTSSIDTSPKIAAVRRGILAWMNRSVEQLALSDYLDIVARKPSELRPAASRDEPHPNG